MAGNPSLSLFSLSLFFQANYSNASIFVSFTYLSFEIFNSLLQSSYSCLCFQDVLWPEFSIWNFFSAIISYQKNYQAIQTARERHSEHLKQIQYESDRQCVTEECQQNRRDVHSGADDLEQNIATYAKHRQERIENFLEHVKAKHREYLEHACPVT